MCHLACWLACCCREDDAVLRLTEEPAFRRRVTAEVAAHTPVTGARMLMMMTVVTPAL
jgi:hypothetical protein